MKRLDVIALLEAVRDAKKEWTIARITFDSDVHAIMRRLLHEAAHNYMSPEDVAKASGFTTKRVRQMMRDIGLNPRDGKNLLNRKAAEALATNADLMGIEPRDMDLMSPLAYLPMGSVLKRQLQDRAVSQVTAFPETITLEPEQAEALQAAVVASDGIVPVSVESLVHMAVDAFLEGMTGE